MQIDFTTEELNELIFAVNRAIGDAESDEEYETFTKLREKLEGSRGAMG